MLPKSNQNQIYLWIDAPRWWNIEKTSKIEKDLANWLLNKKNTNNVIENITSVIGQAYTWDFANLFRWWLNRIWENQISARINLVPPEEYKELTWEKRPSSEYFTIQIREKFKDYLLTKYPDIKIKLLEDPPGPPVRSTFLIKIKTEASNKDTNYFVNKIFKEVQKIAPKQELVDIWTSKSTTYKKLKINLDHESISRAWLTVEQVEYSLAIALNWMDISLVKNYNSYEPTNIEIVWKTNQINNIDLLKTISFTNPSWEKIPLTSIATIENTFVSPEINTDWRKETTYIYWEMWDNSLIYPVIKLYWILMDKNFLWNDYKLDSWSPYEIKYTWLKDWKKYVIEWWGEWELTMDTFRDLGMAMAISLLAIYFLLVGQFASFWVAWIIMITFLLGFFGVWPWFTFLYLVNNEYFSATSMIWVIALAWIVVWNAIILIEYLNTLKKNWLTIKDALLKAWYVRFAPIILTSLTTVFGAATIIWDPVWAWLAWSIIWWLSISSFLTLIVIPIFYYDSQEKAWNACMESTKKCDE
jgi:multidrug efflux pump subunit AcrB